MGVEDVRAFFEGVDERWPVEALAQAERTFDELHSVLTEAVRGTGRDEPREALAALHAAKDAVARARGLCVSAGELAESYAGDL